MIPERETKLDTTRHIEEFDREQDRELYSGLIIAAIAAMLVFIGLVTGFAYFLRLFYWG